MVWTWAEIIADALVRSGLVGLGQTADAQLMVQGRKALELLLDEWDGAGLALPNFDVAVTFDTVASQSLYLLGVGAGAANTTRPETIVTATCTITTSPTARVTMAEIPYPQYAMIPVPYTESQPYNYAINATWPQMGLYLYPTPNAVYPITLTCKVKWASTVGDPDLNPFSEAEVPSGYVAALVDNLALKLAENWRLETPILENKARNGRSMIALAVYQQNAMAAQNAVPTGIFSWNIITAGRNP